MTETLSGRGEPTHVSGRSFLGLFFTRVTEAWRTGEATMLHTAVRRLEDDSFAYQGTQVDISRHNTSVVVDTKKTARGVVTETHAQVDMQQLINQGPVVVSLNEGLSGYEKQYRIVEDPVAGMRRRLINERVFPADIHDGQLEFSPIQIARYVDGVAGMQAEWRETTPQAQPAEPDSLAGAI